MAGSLSHIINKDGAFDMNMIENLGDAEEALEECFQIIFALSNGDSKRVSNVCNAFRFADPWDCEFGEPEKLPMRL